LTTKKTTRVPGNKSPARWQAEPSKNIGDRMLDTRGANCAQDAKPEFRDYLIAELRCAALRARLIQSDIEAVGIALKGGLISPELATSMLHDCDVLRLVAPESAP
jgi:hypothetical protein